MSALKDQINQDLKSAMLARDEKLVTTLRGLKSAILYAEVAVGKRQEGLSEAELVAVLQKEAKKRQESADLFGKGGNQEKQRDELAEKEVIENYLPAQMNDDDLRQVVKGVLEKIDSHDSAAFGKAIGLVKQQVGAQADGGRIAKLIKEQLTP